MKVKELLEELKKADLESEVVFYTDEWLMSVLIIGEGKAITEDDENVNLDNYDEDDVDNDDEDEYKDLIIVDEEELNVEE